MLIYYVYAYLRKNGTPYYIGKGKNDRAWVKHTNVGTPRNRNQIILLETNLTELGAFALERRMIRWYGRKGIDPNGILHNKAEGGEGSSLPGELNPMYGKPRTPEVKRKLSLANLGKKMPEAIKEKIRNTIKGQKRSEESKKRMSEKQKLAGGYGPKQHSQATREKLSKKLKGLKRSEETKMKQSEAARATQEKRRASGWKPPKDASLRAVETRRARIASGEINPYSEERNKKMAASKKGTKRKYLPDGSFVMVKLQQDQ